MALSNEERDNLFEALRNGEAIEDRAESIIQLQAELQEQTQEAESLQTSLSEMTDKYKDSQVKFGELMNSLPNFKTKEEEQKAKEKDDIPEVRGFAKLRK